MFFYSEGSFKRVPKRRFRRRTKHEAWGISIREIRRGLRPGRIERVPANGWWSQICILFRWIHFGLGGGFLIHLYSTYVPGTYSSFKNQRTQQHQRAENNSSTSKTATLSSSCESVRDTKLGTAVICVHISQIIAHGHPSVHSPRIIPVSGTKFRKRSRFLRLTPPSHQSHTTTQNQQHFPRRANRCMICTKLGTTAIHISQIIAHGHPLFIIQESYVPVQSTNFQNALFVRFWGWRRPLIKKSRTSLLYAAPSHHQSAGTPLGVRGEAAGTTTTTTPESRTQHQQQTHQHYLVVRIVPWYIPS